MLDKIIGRKQKEEETEKRKGISKLKYKDEK